MHTIFTNTVDENVYFGIIMFDFQGEKFRIFYCLDFSREKLKGGDFLGLFMNKKHCMQMMSREQIGM